MDEVLLDICDSRESLSRDALELSRRLDEIYDHQFDNDYFDPTVIDQARELGRDDLLVRALATIGPYYALNHKWEIGIPLMEEAAHKVLASIDSFRHLEKPSVGEVLNRLYVVSETQNDRVTAFGSALASLATLGQGDDGINRETYSANLGLAAFGVNDLNLFADYAVACSLHPVISGIGVGCAVRGFAVAHAASGDPKRGLEILTRALERSGAGDTRHDSTLFHAIQLAGLANQPAKSRQWLGLLEEMIGPEHPRTVIAGSVVAILESRYRDAAASLRKAKSICSGRSHLNREAAEVDFWLNVIADRWRDPLAAADAPPMEGCDDIVLAALTPHLLRPGVRSHSKRLAAQGNESAALSVLWSEYEKNTAANRPYPVPPQFEEILREKCVAGNDTSLPDEAFDFRRAIPRQILNQSVAALYGAVNSALKRGSVVIRHDFAGALSLLNLSVATYRHVDPETGFRRISQAVSNLNAILEVLQSVSMIEYDRVPIEPVPTALGNLMAGAIEPFRVVADTKGQHLTFVCELQSDRLEDVFEVDPNILTLVVANLVGNALKYCPSDSTVQVLLRHDASSGGAEIVVSDDGPGLGRGDPTVLFRPFTRGNAEPTGGESSLGLGLYIVARLCDKSGWKITAADTGNGARFSLWLGSAPEQATGVVQRVADSA